MQARLDLTRPGEAGHDLEKQVLTEPDTTMQAIWRSVVVKAAGLPFSMD